jgi:tetratricopeptide (TPR) repeat protein
MVFQLADIVTKACRLEALVGCTAATMAAAASGQRSGQSYSDDRIAFVRRGLRLEGTVRARTGDYGGALAAFQCSAGWAQRTAWAKLTASSHVDAALDEAAAGAMLARLGRYADARAALERALRATQAQLDVSAPLLGRMRSQLALLLLEAGELSQPLQLAEAAAALLRHTKGATHPDVIVPLRVRCLALRGLGRGTQALEVVSHLVLACPRRTPLLAPPRPPLGWRDARSARGGLDVCSPLRCRRALRRWR